MSFIRPLEAMLFHQHKRFLRSPVLDFGCGDGFFAHLVYGKNKIQIGLEVANSPRVHEAEKRNVYKKILLYDGVSVPLKSNSVQTVISNCVFEHIPRISQSVEEIYRILKKDGYCITSVMTSDWSRMMWGTKFFGKKYAEWLNSRQEHESLFSRKQWGKLFRKAGFKIVEEIGYVDEKTAKWFDLFHYLSLPSLITYKLFKRWVLLPWMHTGITRWIEALHTTSQNENKHAACFFVLRK